LNIAINQSSTHESTLIWAIICSVLLHGLLAVMIPNIKFDEVKVPEILEVELVKKPEPPPVVQPEPVQPQPEVVKPKIEPKPQPKPIVKQPIAPVAEKTEPMAEQPAQITTPPEVIAVAPTPEATPTHTVPAPVPVVKQDPPPVPSQTDIDDARGKYGNILWGAISKHKKYPKIAQMRGWQGEAIVELQLDGNGKIKSKKIAQSSGYEALDKQALEMVEKASPFPTPPETLRSSNFTITVPVPFKLE
jgi:protein TonB